MIKAVIFDCFGVFLKDPVKVVQKTYAWASDADRQNFQGIIHAADRGIISLKEFLTLAAECLHVSEAETRQLLFTTGKNTELLHYAQQLRNQYKVGLLSNVQPEMMNTYFSKEERKTLFDAVVLSGDVGLVKPSVEIYQYACNLLGIDPQEAVMIDDVPTNILGAQRAGLKGICYIDNAQVIADLTKLLVQ